MEKLIAMKQELNAIGNNLNQSVKKLHTLKQISEKGRGKLLKLEVVSFFLDHN